MQTQRKTFRLGRRPAKQGPRPLSKNLGRVEKSVTGQTMTKESTILSQGHAKQLQMRNKHRIGTWNICSMLQLGKVQLLGEETMRLGVESVDICGLSEVRWDGQGHFTTTRKATGPDDVPAQLFKAGGETELDRMHRICVAIWETGDWPEEWTFSTFIPLPKKGVLTQCENYRTTSLVSHASKILLQIILQERIRVETKTEIADEHAGFR